MLLLHTNPYAPPTTYTCNFLFLGGGKGLQISFHFLPELRFLWDICLNVTWSKGWSWTKIFEMPILHTLQMIYYISSSFDHTKLLSLLHIYLLNRRSLQYPTLNMYANKEENFSFCLTREVCCKLANKFSSTRYINLLNYPSNKCAAW